MKVTILTSLFHADNDVEPFLQDIVSTEGFGVDSQLFIDDVRSSHADPCRVRRIVEGVARYHRGIVYTALDKDPGLYNLWNGQIKRSRTPYLALACLDDRRNPSSLREHAAALEARNDIDVVCGPTLGTSRPGETFAVNSAYRSFSASFNWQSEVTSSVGSASEFGLDDLFRRDAKGRWIDSDNIPHCMPMWRKSLNDRFGYFDESTYGPLADWEFWIRCASGGARFLLLERHAGLYLINPDSHNRRLPTDHIKRAIIERYRKDRCAD